MASSREFEEEQRVATELGPEIGDEEEDNWKGKEGVRDKDGSVPLLYWETSRHGLVQSATDEGPLGPMRRVDRVELLHDLPSFLVGLGALLGSCL